MRQQLLQQASEAGSRPWVVASRGLVAEFFGVSTQTIKDWKSNGMPGSPGHWDLKEIRIWQDRRREQNVQAVGDQFAPVKGDILREEHRHKKLRNDNLDGKLVLVSEVQRAVVLWAVRMRSRMMSLPSDLALLVPSELKSIIKFKSDNTVRIALQEASDAEFYGDDIGHLIINEADRLKQQKQSSQTGDTQ